MTDPVAVVDIGSGSVKLLITGTAGLVDSGAELVRTSVKVNLISESASGSSSGSESLITDEVLATVADAFERFNELIAAHGVSTVAVVGTEACRRATNLSAIEQLVTDTFNTELEVLDGEREAELAFAGAIAGRELKDPVVVVDIGARSTEFAINGHSDELASLSLPVGGRTLVDLYLQSDPYRPEELSSALTVMELHLDDLRRELPFFGELAGQATVIGVGAVGQIAAVEIGSQDPEFDVDGETLDKVGVEEVFRALATEQERTHNPGLHPGNAVDIVGAMCVLVEFMRQFAVTELLVSERELSHGLAGELLSGRSPTGGTPPGGMPPGETPSGETTAES